MRALFLACIAFLVNTSTIHAQNHCPVNFDSTTLIAAQKEVKKWNKTVIAFNAVVIEVKKGHHDKPYYKVKIGNNGILWIASLVKSGYEIPGKELRILGYFSKVGNDEVAKKYNQANYHVLAYAIIDIETKKMSMLPEAKLDVQDWINGKIPKGHP